MLRESHSNQFTYEFVTQLSDRQTGPIDVVQLRYRVQPYATAMDGIGTYTGVKLDGRHI